MEKLEEDVIKLKSLAEYQDKQLHLMREGHDKSMQLLTDAVNRINKLEQRMIFIATTASTVSAIVATVFMSFVRLNISA